MIQSLVPPICAFFVASLLMSKIYLSQLYRELQELSEMKNQIQYSMLIQEKEWWSFTSPHYLLSCAKKHSLFCLYQDDRHVYQKSPSAIED